MRNANYIIERNDPGDPLIIRDVGPWDVYPTVTNAAEEVVRELVQVGLLPDGRGLLYYDSEGILGEILYENGRFVDFKHVAGEVRQS